MQTLLQITMSIMLLLLSNGAAQAQSAEAGKVLLSLGDVKVVRDGKTQTLAKGASVQAGDAITTGVASNAQLRMSDGAVIAIRAQSEFKINEYKFNGKEDGSEKATLSLVKGGVRAVTGSIGRTNQDNLKVNAVVATVGIRGTGFNINYCNGDCVNKDKSPAKDGLYAGVFEGKITVSNQAGTEALGVNQYLYVADKDVAPVRLSTPPNFLPDPLAGQKSAKPKTGGSQAADIPSLNVAVSTPAPSADSQVSSAPSSIPSVGGISINQQPALASTTSPYTPSTLYNLSSLGDGIAPVTGSPTLYMQRAEVNPGGVIGTDGLPPHNIIPNTDPSTYDLVQIQTNGSSVSPVVTQLKVAGYNATGTSYPFTYSIGSAQQQEGGNLNGIVSWGRWSNGTLTNFAGYGPDVFLPLNSGFDYIVGTRTDSSNLVALSNSRSTINFSLLGATTPYAVSNPQGSWSVTSGNLTANFANASLSGNVGLYTNQPAGYGFFNMGVSGSLSPAAASNTVTTSVNLISGSITTCTATCGGSGNVTFYGNASANGVTGANAAGLSYNFNTGSNVVQGVAVFKR